jgi:hypothetical protein
MTGGEQKTRNYNDPLVPVRHCLKAISKRGFGQLNERVLGVEIRPTAPDMIDKVFELPIRGRLPTAVADD